MICGALAIPSCVARLVHILVQSIRCSVRAVVLQLVATASRERVVHPLSRASQAPYARLRSFGAWMDFTLSFVLSFEAVKDVLRVGRSCPRDDMCRCGGTGSDCASRGGSAAAQALEPEHFRRLESHSLPHTPYTHKPDHTYHNLCTLTHTHILIYSHTHILTYSDRPWRKDGCALQV